MKQKNLKDNKASAKKDKPQRGLSGIEIAELKFDPGTSLIPIVTQDWLTKEVLMVAYSNEEALRKTIETGYAHYWSRSRGRLWRKGETSGNTQTLKDILVDCDHDTIIFLVEQKGTACHTGESTCFHKKLSRSIPRV